MNVLSMSLTGDDSGGWIWGVRVDDLELFRTEPLARNDLAAALFSVQRDNSRSNPYFCDVSDEDLLLILDGFFFGALHDALRASAEEQTWARHLVSPTLPATVWSRMYLVGCGGDKERLLVWQSQRRRTYRIAAGSFDKELSEVVRCLEK
ncbi:MAG: hypothetical protein HY698_13030 [Deltaproteobacteria bacterium]|nr:hypothetical protein [Deltaproteobacteria bacterium]